MDKRIKKEIKNYIFLIGILLITVVSGEYTYSTFPISPSAEPDADYEFANKKYIDDNDFWNRTGTLLSPKNITDDITTNGSLGIGVVPTNPISIAGTYDNTVDAIIKSEAIIDTEDPDTFIAGFENAVTIKGDNYTNVHAFYNVPVVQGINANIVSAQYNNPFFISSTVTNAYGLYIAGGSVIKAPTNYKAIFIHANQPLSDAANRYAFYSNYAYPSRFNGDIQIEADNKKMSFGALNDATIYYDSVDLIVDPKEVGTGKVKILGDLNVTNNITGSLMYGGLTGSDIGTINIGSSSVYHNVTNVSAQLLNGFSFNESGMGELKVLVSGVYEILSTWSFSGTAGTEYHLAVGINYERQIDCHAERVIGTGGDVGSASTTPCIKQLNEGDNVTLMIENVDSATDPTIHGIGLTAKRIGN